MTVVESTKMAPQAQRNPPRPQPLRALNGWADRASAGCLGNASYLVQLLSTRIDRGSVSCFCRAGQEQGIEDRLGAGGRQAAKRPSKAGKGVWSYSYQNNMSQTRREPETATGYNVRPETGV